MLQTMLTTYTLLPAFRTRKSGVIINIASRAATVDFPFAVGYNSSKAAVARATSTLQEELELDDLGQGIQMYALHPGGVLTDMAKSKYFLLFFFPSLPYPSLAFHSIPFHSLTPLSPPL